MSEQSMDPRHGDELLEDVEKETKEPDMYKVVLHNDDYTTREFVVEVLQIVFHKPAIEATKIMMDVQERKRGRRRLYLGHRPDEGRPGAPDGQGEGVSLEMHG